MKRPNQHEIDTAAVRAVQSILPRSWVFREIGKDDYGIDGEIEVFQGQKSTGLIIKVQIKGTEQLKLNSAEDTISFQLGIEKAKYLSEEVRIPVIFIVCDVISGKAFWNAAQLDHDFRSRLLSAVESAQGSLVLHIPVNNELSNTIDHLLDNAIQCRRHLALQTLINEDVSKLLVEEILRGSNTGIVSVLNSHASIARLTDLERRFNDGQAEEVRREILDILASPGIDIRMRFAACELLERIDANASSGQSEIADVSMRISKTLAQISSNGPDDLKIYAYLRVHAAKISKLAIDEYGLYMNSCVNRDSEDLFCKLMVNENRTALSERIHQEYLRCIRYLHIMADKNAGYLLPQAIIRLVYAMMLFVQRLKGEGLSEAANRYIGFLEEAIELGVGVACSREQWDDVMQLALSSLCLVPPEDEPQLEDAISRIYEMLGRIRDEDVARKAHRLISKQLSHIRESAMQEFNEDDEEAETAIYKEMAAAMGIDIEDPEDRIAEVVRLGLKDLNPERVLRNCMHLFVTIGPMGLPARWLRMPTAGFKHLWCVKKGVCIQGLDLDRTYDVMRDQYCKECEDADPYQDDWKWSKAWQRRQNEIHERFIR